MAKVIFNNGRVSCIVSFDILDEFIKQMQNVLKTEAVAVVRLKKLKTFIG